MTHITKCIACAYLTGLLFLCLWVPKRTTVGDPQLALDCGWGFVWNRPPTMQGLIECRAANKVDFGRVALAMTAWTCAAGIAFVLTRK